MQTPCPRCGLRRETNESRGVGLCRDCKDVEQDLTTNGHGTRNSYLGHLRDHTPVCDACREANRQYQEHQRRKQGIPPRQPAQCGTNGGYAAHRYRNEPYCNPCRQAHSLAAAQYRARTNWQTPEQAAA